MEGFDLRGVEDQDGTCACGGVVKQWTVERIGELHMFPLKQSVRVRTACLGCKRRSDAKASAERAAEFRLTRGIRLRILTSYLVYAAVLAVLTVGAWRVYFSTGERVANPEVGDRWTVRTADWRTEYFGATFKFGAVMVDGLDGDEIDLRACHVVTNSELRTRRRCTEGMRPFDSVERTEAIQLAKSGAIVDVARNGDYGRLLRFVGGAVLLFGGWIALNAPLRRRRYRLAVA